MSTEDRHIAKRNDPVIQNISMATQLKIFIFSSIELNFNCLKHIVVL